MHELDLARQQFINAVAHDGVGLAATDLHQHPGPGRTLGDLSRQGPRNAMVAVFVKILHMKRAPTPEPVHGSARGRKLRFRWRQFRFQRSHLFQKLVGTFSFGRVDAAYGETHMDHHIVSQTSLGNKIQRYLAYNSGKLHAGRTHRTRLLDFEDFPWYGKAHGSFLHYQYIIGCYRDL